MSRHNCENCGAVLPVSRKCEYCGTDYRSEGRAEVVLEGEMVGRLVIDQQMQRLQQALIDAGIR